MADKVHIVPHMHWDREWYFTDEESRILLVNNMEEILTTLESCKEYPHYILDGQTSILEDYLSVVPKNKERIKKLVKAGRLIIGPWYTQTDEMVVGGESIVRNLLYGFKDCKEFGPVMEIGYLPDSFGQSARMPQILNGFGIKWCIFWRGTSERFGTDKTEFHWTGADNADVIVQLMPLGYAIGKYLPSELEALKKRMDKYFPILEKGAVTENLLLPNGHDQMPIQKNIFEVMNQLRKLYPDKEFFLSKYQTIFEVLEHTELPSIKGEFLDGKYMRVHRSIYSSRADLKSANTRIENKITNHLEPLASIAYALGFDYYHGLIESIWKELLKNHAHDSIGCCCSDKVHKVISGRFFLAEEKTDRLTEFYMRKIADAVDSHKSEETLTVFNTLPYERQGVVKAEVITKMKRFLITDENNSAVSYEITSKEIVDAGLIDRQLVHYEDYTPFIRYGVAFESEIPPMGYKTFTLKPTEENPFIMDDTGSKAADRKNVLENNLYCIEICPNGSLTIMDKAKGETYNKVLVIEDGSDDGDGYDYSPLEDDYIVTSENLEADINIIKNELMQTASIKLSMAVPKDLDSRRKKICDGTIGAAFQITLTKGDSNIHIKMRIDNQAKDHRVRVLIPTGTGNQHSISDNQFGRILRSVRDPAMDLWEREGWSERPDSIYPFLTYAAGDSKEGLRVFTNSVREYELIGEKYETIALTIFRCVGVLGKEELYRRPGRPSGIKLPTPDSQMQGCHEFIFAISVKTKNPAKSAKEYTTPFLYYNKNGYNAMKLNPAKFTLPATYSLLCDNNSDAVLSCAKKAEEQDGIILRYYNGTEESAELKLDCQHPIAGEVNLKEEWLEEKAIAESIRINPNQIKNFMVPVS